MNARNLLFLTIVLYITSIESKLTTFILGDAGKVGTQLDTVTNSVKNFAKEYNPNFMILAGDNVYENGLQSVDPEEDSMKNFNEFWSNFDSDELKDIPFYAVLGNHDWHEIVNQQNNCDLNCEILYFYQAKMDDNEYYDERFNLENDYYTKIYDINDEQTLQIIYIDTVTLAFDTTLTWLEEMVEEGEIDISVLEQWKDSRRHIDFGAIQQLGWIEEQLKLSTADYLIVVGHYPVYGDGEHHNTPELLILLNPLLKKYNVDAYFNGHSHTLEHISSDSVQYFTSGAASKTGTIDYNNKNTQYASATPGYMIIEIDENNMNVSVVDANEDKIVYDYTIPQTRKL